MSTYLLHITIEACVLSTLAVSLNLMAGYGRLVSLGQLTFYAIGSYTAAIVAPLTSFGYLLAIPAGLSIAAVTAVVVSLATLNLKDDEFAIATFAIHIAVWTLLMNWQTLTNGPLGITNIPSMHVDGFALDEPLKFTPIAVGLLAISLTMIWQINRKPFGFLLRMFRDDEELARNFGRNVGRLRTSVWILAGMIAAAAGLVQSAYLGYVNPVSFSSMESTILLAVVILGGLGTFWGPVIGGFVMTFIPEVFRFLGFPTTQAANIRQMLLGLVLVAVAFQMSMRRGGSLPMTQRNRIA